MYVTTLKKVSYFNITWRYTVWHTSKNGCVHAENRTAITFQRFGTGDTPFWEIETTIKGKRILSLSPLYISHILIKEGEVCQCAKSSRIPTPLAFARGTLLPKMPCHLVCNVSNFDAVGRFYFTAT